MEVARALPDRPAARLGRILSAHGIELGVPSQWTAAGLQETSERGGLLALLDSHQLATAPGQLPPDLAEFHTSFGAHVAGAPLAEMPALPEAFEPLLEPTRRFEEPLDHFRYFGLFNPSTAASKVPFAEAEEAMAILRRPVQNGSEFLKGLEALERLSPTAATTIGRLRFDRQTPLAGTGLVGEPRLLEHPERLLEFPIGTPLLPVLWPLLHSLGLYAADPYAILLPPIESAGEAGPVIGSLQRHFRDRATLAYTFAFQVYQDLLGTVPNFFDRGGSLSLTLAMYFEYLKNGGRKMLARNLDVEDERETTDRRWEALREQATERGLVSEETRSWRPIEPRLNLSKYPRRRSHIDPWAKHTDDHWTGFYRRHPLTPFTDSSRRWVGEVFEGSVQGPRDLTSLIALAYTIAPSLAGALKLRKRFDAGLKLRLVPTGSQKGVASGPSANAYLGVSGGKVEILIPEGLPFGEALVGFIDHAARFLSVAPPLVIPKEVLARKDAGIVARILARGQARGLFQGSSAVHELAYQAGLRGLTLPVEEPEVSQRLIGQQGLGAISRVTYPAGPHLELLAKQVVNGLPALGRPPQQRPTIDWMNLHERLPQLLAGRSTTPRELLRQVIIESLEDRYGIPGSRFRGSAYGTAEVLLESLENVEFITGRRIHLPIVAFNDLDRFNRLMERIGPTANAVTLAVSYQRLLAAVGLEGDPSRELRVILWSSVPRARRLVPEELLRHEAVHAADPGVDRSYRNSEALLLSEMAAFIGESALPKLDRNEVDIHENVWTSYVQGVWNTMAADGKTPGISSPLQRLLQFSAAEAQALRSSDESAFAVGRRLRRFVRSLTAKYSNTEVVRLIYRSRSFEELERALAFEQPIS